MVSSAARATRGTTVGMPLAKLPVSCQPPQSDMALPKFNSAGDLPEGVHRATLDEAIARFGMSTEWRKVATERLVEISRLARSTGNLERLIIFGSYVTSKPMPGDIDMILVSRDDFDMRTCDESTKPLFDHIQAAQRFGASLFWVRPGMLINETLASFIGHWQLKRDGGFRGIVEPTL